MAEVEELVELARRCAGSRDEALWRCFVERVEEKIRLNVVQALRRTPARPRRDLIEELAQDVYCRLLERDRRALRRCRARSESSFMGYLGRVCESVVIDHVRAQSTVKRGGRAKPLDPVGENGRDRVEGIADPNAGPERRYLAAEARRCFLRSCAHWFRGETRERDLEIFRLAFVDGWTSREIADRFEGTLKPGSIDSMIHRNRQRLTARGVAVPER